MGLLLTSAAIAPLSGRNIYRKVSSIDTPVDIAIQPEFHMNVFTWDSSSFGFRGFTSGADADHAFVDITNEGKTWKRYERRRSANDKEGELSALWQVGAYEQTGLHRTDVRKTGDRKRHINRKRGQKSQHTKSRAGCGHQFL